MNDTLKIGMEHGGRKITIFYPPCSIFYLLADTVIEKKCLIEGSSSLAQRRMGRTNALIGRPDAPCQAEGHEEAPAPGGAGARAAFATVALATAGQDSRRRATNQVIQRSTTSWLAVL
jgi:hypothetical protein